MRFTKPTDRIQFRKFNVLDRSDIVKLNEFLEKKFDIIERKELYVPPIPPSKDGSIPAEEEKHYYEYFYIDTQTD